MGSAGASAGAGAGAGAKGGGVSDPAKAYAMGYKHGKKGTEYNPPEFHYPSYDGGGAGQETTGSSFGFSQLLR